MYSIPNLVAHLSGFLGLKPFYDKTNFKKLSSIDESNLIVHILIDGLGYEFLKARGGFLYSNCIGFIDSTFPSSTSVAMTAYYTGKYPGDNGIFGRNQLLPISKKVIQPLPLSSQTNDENTEISDLFSSLSPFWLGSKSVVKIIFPESYINSYYSKSLIRDCEKITYVSEDDRVLKTNMEGCIKHKDKTYILSYRPGFDDLCHKFGVDSIEVSDYFISLERKVIDLVQSIKNSHGNSAKILISSDHGHIQSKEDQIHNIDSMLTQLKLNNSATGESRFFYISTESSDIDVRKVLDQELGFNNYQLFTTNEGIERGLFGPNFNIDFANRIGTHVIILNNSYQVISGKQPKYIGNHGGLSDKEVKIPVILI